MLHRAPYVDPTSKAALAATILVIVFFALRTWSRKIQGTRLPWIDGFMVAAVIVSLAHSTLMTVTVTLGYDMKYIPALHKAVVIGRNDLFFKGTTFYGGMVYIILASLPRLAVCGLYLNVFSTHRSICYTCYALAIILVLQPIVNIPITITTCAPVAYEWNKSIPGGHCGNTAVHGMWMHLPNIIVDAVLLFAPLPVLAKLRITTREKVGIFITFIVGSGGLVTSILRFVTFAQWAKQDVDTPPAATVGVWVSVEPTIYIICACMLSMRPLLNHLLDKLDVRSPFKPASERPPTWHSSWLASFFNRTRTQGTQEVPGPSVVLARHDEEAGGIGGNIEDNSNGSRDSNKESGWEHVELGSSKHDDGSVKSTTGTS